MKYKKEYDDQVRKLCLLGAIDDEIADFFNVARSTISIWKNEHEGFFNAMQEGKLSADANVADALYRVATGYDKEETLMIKGEQVRTVKHYPPNVNGIRYFLNNRRRKSIENAWRDRQEIEHKVDDDKMIVPILNVTIDGNKS